MWRQARTSESLIFAGKEGMRLYSTETALSCPTNESSNAAAAWCVTTLFGGYRCCCCWWSVSKGFRLSSSWYRGESTAW